jgi:hypothetical protein
MCYNRFVQSYSPCNYESVFNYFKRFIPDGNILMLLSLINVFNNKINPCSAMETVGLRVSTKQTRDCSTSNISMSQDLAPSARCVTAANIICRSLDVFKIHIVACTPVAKQRPRNKQLCNSRC